jgi:REP element-mobilizing transposase RayT
VGKPSGLIAQGRFTVLEHPSPRARGFIPVRAGLPRKISYADRQNNRNQNQEVNMPYWRLFYHIVWGTKNRLPLIESAWEKDLYGYIWGKATALECIPHAINGMSDHLHVVISIPPKLSVATLIGQLKGASSIMSMRNMLTARLPGRRNMEC